MTACVCVCIHRNDKRTKISKKDKEYLFFIEQNVKKKRTVLMTSLGGFFFVSAKGDQFSHALLFIQYSSALELLN